MQFAPGLENTPEGGLAFSPRETKPVRLISTALKCSELPCSYKVKFQSHKDSPPQELVLRPRCSDVWEGAWDPSMPGQGAGEAAKSHPTLRTKLFRAPLQGMEQEMEGVVAVFLTNIA